MSSYAKVEEATQIIESLIRYHAKVDPAMYFESRRETNEDDAVVDTSEDETEVLGNLELDQPVDRIGFDVHLSFYFKEWQNFKFYKS